MKIINQYKFKNGKILQICLLNSKDKGKKIPKVDDLLFHWSMDNGRSFEDGLYIRADEALLIVKMLSDAVYKITKGYNIGLLKGYYGYSEILLNKDKIK